MQYQYRFGSFNLRNLSEAGITKRDFDTIANIIRKERLDVVGFQEILSEGKALQHMMKHNFRVWDFRWGEPCES